VGRTALIVTDTLNHYEHEDADKLVASVEEVLPNVVALRDRANEAGVPVIYVNDNHDEWESNRQRLVEGARRDLVEPSLTMMERNMHAEVCDAGDCRLGERH
jgi:nicotinamidase-related amidase